MYSWFVSVMVIFMCILVAAVSLVNSTCAVRCMERIISKVSYSVLCRSLNFTHHSL